MDVVMITATTLRYKPFRHWLIVTAVTMLVLGCQNNHNQSLLTNGLVYCSEGSPESFNPQLVTSGTSFDASAHVIYNRLVEFKPGTTTITPALAKSWTISPDGRTYTFFLRRGIQFHHTDYFTPTRDFNADDVIFSFNRQRLPNHPYHFVSGGAYPYFESTGLSDLILDIEKVDQYTVRFYLRRPESPFLSTLSMEFLSILSAEYANKLAQDDNYEQIDNLPIGTGPFVFQRYERDQLIRYKQHASYWRNTQSIDYLVYAITPDPSLRYARFRANECQVMAQPLPTHIEAMRDDEHINIQAKPGLNVAYWAFNTRKPPLNDPRIRIALNHAVNRDRILKVVYNNAGTIAINPVSPITWAHNEAVHDYDYNPDKARSLIEQAGYSEALNIDIWAMPVQRPYNPNAFKMAELIQDDLRQIGVKSTIKTFDLGVFLHKVSQGEHQTALLGWSADNGDPDNFFTPLLGCSAIESGSNRAFWCHQRFDQLITKAKRANDIGTRKKLYDEAQVIFKQQAPWLTIAHAMQYQVSHRSVQGLAFSPSGGVYFEGVTIAL